MPRGCLAVRFIVCELHVQPWLGRNSPVLSLSYNQALGAALFAADAVGADVGICRGWIAGRGPNSKPSLAVEVCLSAPPMAATCPRLLVASVICSTNCCSVGYWLSCCSRYISIWPRHHLDGGAELLVLRVHAGFAELRHDQCRQHG